MPVKKPNRKKRSPNNLTFDAAHSNPVIADKLARIYNLHRQTIDFRLERSPYAELLERLGNPHCHLPPVIHIAGTNGKGSTLAFIRSIYQEAGHKVQSYTSPHLFEFNERISLDDNHVSDETLLRYLNIVEEACDGLAVTFFEYTTALAFKIFADHRADICLLETGLGGRLDCTNIIPTAAATVITNIGFDHMEYLGNTIQDIAGEKAGIMKRNVPCIISPQEYPAVYEIFEDTARELPCPLYKVGKTDDVPPLGLTGKHQTSNAATALAVINELQNAFPVPQTAIEDGLRTCRWPARMERIESGPVHVLLKNDAELWFDCGHNTQGAKAIAKQLEIWKDEDRARKIHIILALPADKDAQDYVAALNPCFDTLTCIDLPNARHPQSGSALAERIRGTHSLYTAPDITTAVNQLNYQTNDKILICGSLYLYQFLW